MSISSEVRKAGPFAGNDVITDFPFSFKVFSTADVLVVRADSKGAEYKLELGTDYTVSLNANQNTSPGGTVVKASPLVTGDKIVITSRVANLQPTDLTNQGGFYPAVINAALDRATIQIQQLSEKVDRSAKLPITRTEDVDALLSDIVVLADNLTSVNTVAGSIGSVNTVAGVSADVSTVAGNIANINAAVADLPALSAKVSKTGDTMTGPLSVPAGASGAQVPQAQEVVPRAGNVTMTGPLSVPAGASGAQVPQAQEVALLASTQLAGHRNRLINGNFAINQRGYVSGTATSGANQYTLDRWRVVTSGENLTFSASGNGNQVTAPAGGIEQVIEGANIEGGTYVINWTGTATCTVNGTARTKGQSFTLTANTDATIRFSSGTVSMAQLEPGTAPTVFEHRLNELQLCQRYLPAFGGNSEQIGFGGSFDANSTRLQVIFPVTPRVPPTGVFVSSAAHFAIQSGSSGNIALTGISFSSSGKNGALLTATHSGGSAANIAVFFISTNASANLYFTGCEL